MKSSTHRQLACQEGMFHGTLGGLHCRLQVVAVAEMDNKVLPLFRTSHGRCGKVSTRYCKVELLWSAAAASIQLEGQAEHGVGSKRAWQPVVRPSVTEIVCPHHGQVSWVAGVFILLDIKVGQAEFVWDRLCATNGSLNVSDG